MTRNMAQATLPESDPAEELAEIIAKALGTSLKNYMATTKRDAVAAAGRFLVKREGKAEAENERLRGALRDTLTMIGRLKKHCQITDNAGYSPDGRMLRLTDVEEAARAALSEQEGK